MRCRAKYCITRTSRIVALEPVGLALRHRTKHQHLLLVDDGGARFVDEVRDGGARHVDGSAAIRIVGGECCRRRLQFTTFGENLNAPLSFFQTGVAKAR